MYNKTVKRPLAILLSLIMILGTAVPALAEDIEAQSVLNVYVPSGTSVSFFPTTGYDSDGSDMYDPLDEFVTETETDGDYMIYKVPYFEGISYSYRGTDDESGCDIGGGALSGFEAESVIYLRRVMITVKTKNGASITTGDFALSVSSNAGIAVLGSADYNADGNPYYNALLFADGNANLYQITATPTAAYSAMEGLFTGYVTNRELFKGAAPITFTVTLPAAKSVTINAPSGASVTLYQQILNYNAKEIAPESTGDAGDGTIDYTYRVGNADYTYRVSMDGYVTEAGYLSGIIDGDIYTVELSGDLDPKGQISGSAFNKEASVLLNINERGKLSMQVGSKFKVRAYRAAWQIVNDVSLNIMIEPDFTYTILSGDDVISIEQADGGNAGGNWAWVTAKKEGVAFVEVTYDAVNVTSDGRTTLYGASDSLRTGVFAVQVGPGADIGGILWDAEYDTHYFLGDTGSLTVNPAGENVGIKAANVMDGVFDGWTDAELTDDGFIVPIKNGNNIIEIISDGHVDYRVIRGSRLTATVTSPNPDGNFYPGDTVTLSFSGLYQSAPKFSGIYNPGYLGTMKISYDMNGTTIACPGTQYDIVEPAKHAITFTIPESAAGELVLSGGVLQGNCYGSVFGTHRTITDAGVPADFSAPELVLPKIALPDISIPVTLSETESAKALAIDAINTEFSKFKERDYTSANWAAIIKARDDGIAAVTSAATEFEVNTAKSAAINAMAAIAKIPSGQTGDAGNSGINKTHTSSFYPVSGLTFDIPANQIDGYVTISFADYGERLSGERGVEFKTPLGVLISPTQVPFSNGDSMADVTLRLLDALGIGSSYTGSGSNEFYLAAIKDFRLSDGTLVSHIQDDGTTSYSFGEFDAGAGSGWMITLNNRFVNRSTARFLVEDGDVLKWQYTCRYGADIGCDPNNPSAEITGLSFKSNYGTLSPAFSKTETAYVYTIPSSVKSIALEALLENYWSIVTYTSNGTSYKMMRDIPVENGTVIQINSRYAEYADDTPSDTDALTITIQVSGEKQVTPVQPGKTADIILEAVADKEGMANATADTSAVKAAVEAAKQNEAAEVKIEISADNTATGVQVTLQSEALKAVAAESGICLTIESKFGAVTFDSDTLAGIVMNSADGEAAVVTIRSVDAAELEDSVSGIVGEHPVFDLSISVAGIPVKNFDGFATVFLPFASAPDGLTVGYIDPTGKVIQIGDLKYSEADKGFIFATKHLSLFAIIPDSQWAELGEIPFTDVSKDDWFYDAVAYVYDKGLMNGTDDGVFSPHEKLSRAMLVTTLFRLSGDSIDDAEISFDDVPEGEWYYDAVLWAEKNGIAEGFDDGLFRPDRDVTREQTATILMRYAKHIGLDVSQRSELEAFSDSAAVADWASDAVSWSHATGLIMGISSDLLDPSGTATRAQAAQILMRFCGSI